LNNYELEEDMIKAKENGFYIEEAKTRLEDCNVLLKYMVFLQKNGFSDCSKGQIIGQVEIVLTQKLSYSSVQ
jgi:hypothetical protein